ncbi:MAG: hypothetical protein PHD72_00990 [Patescibacteria group bacterium]|nr:hypothetical protein [Patescibacteria group bacterium]
MSSYFLVFFAGLALLLAFAGLGQIVTFLFFNKKRLDFGLYVILGVAIFMIIGGYLNLFEMISRTTLWSLLSLGLLVTLGLFIKNIKTTVGYLIGVWAFIKNNKKFAAVAAVVFLIILARYATAVSFFPFHGSDDYHGYLVFPAKMIQTGHLGEDPFSERRIAPSLGGGHLLNATVLSFASFKNLHLVDNGIGLLLLIILLLECFKDAKLNKNASLLIIFLVSIIPSPSVNATCFLLAAAFFFAIFRILCFTRDLSRSQLTAVLCLTVSALVVLKTNLIIPAAFLFCCFFCLTFYRQNKKIILLNALLVLALFAVALVPWMISMLESSGTLFYPFLGAGYHGASYGNFAGPHLTLNVYSIIRVAVEIFACLNVTLPLIILGYLTFKNTNVNRRMLLCIFVSSLVGIAAVIYGVGAYSLGYYIFSFVVPTILILLVSLLKENKSVLNDVGKYSIYAMMVAVFMLGVYIQKAIVWEGEFERNISFDNGVKIGLLNTEMISAEELGQYKSLQNSVPPQEIILARLDRNFLFDFKRNNIFIIDLPGGSSLPPGLPFREGSEKMADYLLSVGVKYVAYSYGNEANFTKEANSGMLRVHVNPWLRAETEHSFDFQDNLMELYKNRKVLYDDGKNFMLDLSVKK